MNRIVSLFFLPFLLTPLSGQNVAGVRILLGTSDREPTRWDGSVQADGAKVESLAPWRFEGTDEITGLSWKMGTRQPRLFGGAAQPNNQQNRQIVANGVVARLSGVSDASTLHITTPQGNFDVRLSEIPYGTGVAKLNGKAFVDRVPPTERLTETPDEEDFPSAAMEKDGGYWIAYVSFRHHPDHDALRAPRQTPVTDFAKLKAVPGGDQIFARHFANGKWETAVAITEGGGDLYRTSVAMDGRGRAWVFWSANTKGNFDVFARPIQGGKPGRTVQISREAGSDVDPVAATDSTGNVWVAWQGWRAGKASIYGATQKGDGFTTPSTISSSTGNEWDPAIAADKAGHVTVAWDSYRDGNYDVYMRTATGTNWGVQKAIAATARYEAYPSLAYDGSGRLWAAYEEGGAGWGKDFGAYITTGVALYQGRTIRIRGFDTDGRAIALPVDVATILPGVPTVKAETNGNGSGNFSPDPDPTAVQRRVNARAANAQPNPKNTSPRLTIDSSGRVWLAFRSAHPIWWSPLGTIWTEHVVSFDGKRWTGPIYVPHSDNVLDNRPALISTKAGQLTLVGSSDGRRNFQAGQRRGTASNESPAPAADIYNNDLYSNEVSLGAAQSPASFQAASVPAAQAVPDQIELTALKRIRDYRAPSTGLRVLRGEFHRHSEISMDGGGDGSILDQWRYIIDAGALDWVGCCDHDNGGGREYSWWITQKLTDIFYSPGSFIPMFNYERSVVYPEGHRNVLFAQRGIRPLPRLPISGVDAPGHAPDTQMLYAYLKFFNGVVASHTSATQMGTDWRDNDPEVEPIVEIYQGDRQNYEMAEAPRANSEKDSIGGYRPKGYVNLALQKGYMLGFEASSDHISTHISYANVLVQDATREGVLAALKKRHVYGSTDNILAEVRSGTHMMGDIFTSSTPPSLDVKLTGTSKFAKVHVIKDNNYVYSVSPNTANVSFSWMDNAAVPGKASYYYVRGEQDNGEIVWVSPMWITYSK